MTNRHPPSPTPRLRMRGPVAAMLTTLLLACAACPFTPVESAPLSGQVVPVIEPGLWREVFSGLARRADRGDADSARLALEMHRMAPQVYGERFDATPAQLQRWHCHVSGRAAPCPPQAPAA